MNNIKQEAQSLALKMCDNKWWNEMAELDVKAKFPLQETERDLIIKRLHYWVNNMEGDLSTEAPIYATQLSQEVMKIIDRSISKAS